MEAVETQLFALFLLFCRIGGCMLFAPGLSSPRVAVHIRLFAALGLTYWQRLTSVILPQAVRISIAPTVGYLMQLVKDTSLTALIGFIELTRASQILSAATFKPLQVYGLAAIVITALFQVSSDYMVFRILCV